MVCRCSLLGCLSYRVRATPWCATVRLATCSILGAAAKGCCVFSGLRCCDDRAVYESRRQNGTIGECFTADPAFPNMLDSSRKSFRCVDGSLHQLRVSKHQSIRRGMP